MRQIRLLTKQHGVITQKSKVQLQDASASAYSPAILTNSHSTDVNQIPRNLKGYVPIFGGGGGGKKEGKFGMTST